MSNEPASGAVVVGIDVGTSAAKVLVVDERGAVVARRNAPYPLSTPRTGWSEQAPDDWWAAIGPAVRSALGESGADPSTVAAVGVTGQMHGMVALDKAGAVIRPAILWNDQRSAAQCESLHERVGRARVIEITGKPALPSFTAPKVLWLKEHEPEAHARISSVMLPKDYLRLRLTGEPASDVADSSGTSYFDVAARAWSGEMLDAVGLTQTQVPPVHECAEVCARVSADGAAATGLLEGTPVVAGAGDQAAEGVGAGIVAEGAVSVAVGTSGVVFAASASPSADPDGRMHTYCHAVPGMWHVMGVMLSAGGSFDWARVALFPDLHGPGAFDELTARAERVPPGSGGLIFLPYLAGERCPHPNPLARGAFVGLTLRHDRDAMARAVLEGISYGLRDLLGLVRAGGQTVPSVRLSGGAANSPFWRQLLADVLRAEVRCLAVTEGAAFGAAVLALVGGGVFSSVPAAATAIVREGEASAPGQSAEFFERAHREYGALYAALAPRFAGLGSIDSGGPES